MERPAKELTAFTLTTVRAGETRKVDLELPISRLAYYDENQEKFIVEEIEYELFVGAHSLDQNGLGTHFGVGRES